MDVLGEDVVGLVGFVGDVFAFEPDIPGQILELILNNHLILNLLNLLSLIILIPHGILPTPPHIPIILDLITG